MDINKLTEVIGSFLPVFTFIVTIGSNVYAYYFSDKFVKKFLTTNTIRFVGKIFNIIIFLSYTLLLTIVFIFYIFLYLEIDSQEVIEILYQEGGEFKEFVYLFSVVYITSFFLLILLHMLIKEFTSTDKHPKISPYYVLASDISLPVSLEEKTKLYLVQIHKNKECILIFWKDNNFSLLPNRIIINYDELRNKIIYTESKPSFIQRWKDINTEFLNASTKSKVFIFAIIIFWIIIYYAVSILINDKEFFKINSLYLVIYFFIFFSPAILKYFQKLLIYILKKIFKHNQHK